jgi:glucosamine--fructose-6-phosphate aminotransferase (isomerizing)
VTSEEFDTGLLDPRVHQVRLPALPPAQAAIAQIVVVQILVEAVAAARDVVIEEFVFHNNDIKVPGL